MQPKVSLSSRHFSTIYPRVERILGGSVWWILSRSTLILEIESFIHENLPQWECGGFSGKSNLIPEILIDVLLFLFY